MLGRVTNVGLPLIALLVCLGCHGRPPAAYEPPLDLAQLAPGLQPPDNSFCLLADVHTEGRFACPLAIAKFLPQGPENDRQLVLQSPLPEEEAYWTEQVRGVSAIREVVFLRPISVRPEETSLAQLCATAQRLGAPLLLVHVPNRVGPNSARVLGVMYDTASAQPLATLHASSTILNQKGQEVAPDRQRGDHRRTDAQYQAQRAFEGHALACLREMIHLDSPSPTTQPHSWQLPLAERWWIRSRQ